MKRGQENVIHFLCIRKQMLDVHVWAEAEAVTFLLNEFFLLIGFFSLFFFFLINFFKLIC